MRRIFIFLSCLIIVPAMAVDVNAIVQAVNQQNISFADSCVIASKYTIDKRCYVRSSQTTQKPFNAVVKVTTPKQGICTGTIVKFKDHLFLYTAKHCVINKTDDAAQKITIKYQNGKTETTTFNKAGGYKGSEPYTAQNAAKDWAYYSVPTNNAPFVTVSANKGAPSSKALSARVIGYGGLKIMSDNEISEIQNRYRTWLKKNKLPTDEKLNVKQGPGLRFVEELKTTSPAYYKEIFSDADKLKVSNCTYYSDGTYKGCQAWGGTSGGGIFDSNGNIMGIHSGGRRNIGGEGHAQSTFSVSLIGATNTTQAKEAAKSFPDNKSTKETPDEDEQ